MSTSVNPSAAPQEAPQIAGPTPLEPAPKRFRGRTLGAIAAVVVVAASLAAWFAIKSRAQQQKAAPAVVVHTAVARAGTLEQTLRIAGNTTAGRYAIITAPMLRGPEIRVLTLISLATGGSWVKKNEVVAQMDPQAARDHIDDVQAMIVQADGDIRRRKADQAIEEENLRQSLRVTKAALDRARLDLKAAEVRTTIDQELLKLTVEENEASYKVSLGNFDIALASNRSEIRILEITRDRNVRHRERHVSDLVRFTIKAPMEGLVVMQSFMRGGDMAQIQVGDNMSPNQAFMRIVDSKSMMIEAAVNQADSEYIRIGQPATVRYDAFPGLQLKGKVDSIGAIAVGGWRQSFYIRMIPVRIKLLEQDPRVIPDLTASADVVIGSVEGHVVVPVESIFTERGKQVVYVKGPQGFSPREVEVAAKSNTMAAIGSGVKDGETVALQHPAPAKL